MAWFRLSLTGWVTSLAATVLTALPEVHFTSVPGYGTDGVLAGKVTGAAAEAHRAGVFVRRPQNGWYVLPGCNAPLTPIQPDGTWQLRLGVEESDRLAPEIAALVVPLPAEAPCVQGKSRIPSTFTAQAVASALTTRFDPAYRRIQFSGHEWWVKRSAGPVGPGPNYFSDSTNHVWVDPAGRLHLRIAQNAGRWECAEIVSVRSFGYGGYRFEVDANLDTLDPNVVVGLFTWNDDPAHAHREIDIEFSRWGNAADTNNAQFAVQPYYLNGHLVRYRGGPDVRVSTHQFNWESNRVTFLAQRGTYSPAPAGTNVLKQWAHTLRVPPAGGENVRLNLWLFNGKPPTDGQPVEVIVPGFRFVPPGPTRGAGLTNAAPEGAGFEFDVRTEMDRAYAVESSTNLLDWTSRATLLASNLGQTFRLPWWGGAREFFRARTLP
jgi:hypothetical protein